MKKKKTLDLLIPIRCEMHISIPEFWFLGENDVEAQWLFA